MQKHRVSPFTTIPYVGIIQIRYGQSTPASSQPVIQAPGNLFNFYNYST